MDEGRTFPLSLTPSWGSQDRAARIALGRADAARATFVTIATADRIGQCRVFARSAKTWHPDARLVALVLDPGPAEPRFADLFDLLISAEQLSLGCLADMRFRYSLPELCFALKPWIIRHLFDRFPDEPIFYFDSDIELFSPLAEAEGALAGGANLVLTPHILQPAPEQASERALLRTGSFNAGFLGIAPSAQARAFVAWWCERVRTGCTHDHAEGTYGDQKWLELAPSLCDGVAVLRHPGYNFAYWNAHERQLSCLGGVWSAAGWPLRFVHYSQWNLRRQDPEEYLAAYFRRDYQPFAGLFAEYRGKVHSEAADEVNPPPHYPEWRSPAGEAVPEILRRAYARHSPAVDGDETEVYGRAIGLLNAPSPNRADLPDLPITLMYDEIWQRHADLRFRFDIDRPNGRLAFLQWLAETGAAELGLPAAFFGPARAAVEHERIRRLEASKTAPLPEANAPLPAIMPAEPLSALVAAREDIRLLAGANKALRRELQGLRVRHWRDEETIRALEAELQETRGSRDAAAERSRALSQELQQLRLQGPRRRSAPPVPVGAADRVAVLNGEGPFFKRGFLLGDAAAVTGDTVKRNRKAPSGTLIFGPYVSLSAGSYRAVIDARLYRAMPIWADFRVDVVCDGAQQVLEYRKLRLYGMHGWRNFELPFEVLASESYSDFEIRIWARKGTPLEIGRIELYRTAPEAQEAGEG